MPTSHPARRDPVWQTAAVPAVLVYLLTALAALVVVLTRLRLRDGAGGSPFRVGPVLLNAHTAVGTVALVGWVTYMIAPADTVLGGALFGVAVLALWWLLAVLGLLILSRWLPSHGRHVATDSPPVWKGGPWLSVLAHVGMVVAVSVFTWAYLTSVV